MSVTALLFFLAFAHADERPLPYFMAGNLTPYWAAENRAANPTTIDSLKAVNQNNAAVTEKDFSGHLSLINFFFAECGATCPLMMHTLQTLQPKIGAVKTYSFSVDPAHDQPAELKSYATAQHFNLQNWQLLTGAREDIYRLGRDILKADESGRATSASFIHTTNIYLIDKQRRLRGVYDSAKAEAMTLLMHDVARLMLEAPRE